MSNDDFGRYLDYLAAGLGHADRVGRLKDYCTGLMLPIQRKSVEPLAAYLDPSHVSAKHQALLHFVGQSEWSDEALLDRVLNWIQPQMECGAPEWFWVVDDTGIPKKGRHSVGVARQYCGQVGKQDNCQVAVSLPLATKAASVPIAWRLYLPQAWCDDAQRCQAAGVPAAVQFATKPELALHQIWAAKTAGIPVGMVLADAAYGNECAFREALEAMELAYVVGIESSTSVWLGGMAPLPPKSMAGAASGAPCCGVRRGMNPDRPGQWRWDCQPKHGTT
jgi:SRSO17 transposase